MYCLHMLCVRSNLFSRTSGSTKYLLFYRVSVTLTTYNHDPVSQASGLTRPLDLGSVSTAKGMYHIFQCCGDKLEDNQVVAEILVTATSPRFDCSYSIKFKSPYQVSGLTMLYKFFQIPFIVA